MKLTLYRQYLSAPLVVPETCARLEREGYNVVNVDNYEIKSGLVTLKTVLGRLRRELEKDAEHELSPAELQELDKKPEPESPLPKPLEGAMFDPGGRPLNMPSCWAKEDK